MEGSSSIKRDILDSSDIFDEVITEKMNIINDLKSRIPEKIDKNNVEFVEKSFFKRVLGDITDIYMIDDTLNVEFGRGVSMRIESAMESRASRFILETDYRFLKIIGELVDAKQIKMMTSPFIIKLNKNTLKSEYYKSFDEEITERDKSLNIHDAGVNCWGGWSGPIRSNYTELNLENALVIMVQRMKQLNIDDYARNIQKITELIIRSNHNETLEGINPLFLAKLIVEYNLQDFVISGSQYIQKDNRGYMLFLPDALETNINYDAFIDTVERMSKEYSGDKPKIKVNVEQNAGGISNE